LAADVAEADRPGATPGGDGRRSAESPLGRVAAKRRPSEVRRQPRFAQPAQPGVARGKARDGGR